MTVPSPTSVVFERGPRVHLRPYCEADIPLILVWLNEPNTRRYLSRVFPLNEAEEQEFVRRPYGPGAAHESFIIVLSATNTPIGCTGLHQIDWVSRKAELGIFIGSEENRAQGLGTEAFQLAMRHAFEGLNLHRVSLTVFAFNDRAIQSYERIGFIREGVDREAHFVEGEYVDIIRYSMLAREWFAKTDRPPRSR